MLHKSNDLTYIKKNTKEKAPPNKWRGFGMFSNRGLHHFL